MAQTAIIIGSGIGGLSAAIALVQAGVQVEVFEKAHALRDVGAGIILYPNALQVLDALGVLEDVARAGCYLRQGKYLNAAGKVLAALDFTSVGMEVPTIAIHRADLQRVLSEKVGVNRIHLGAACKSIGHVGKNRVCAELSDGSQAEADILIGADGLHSVVRNHLLGDGPPRFANCFAWRGVTVLDHPAILPGSGLMIFGRGLQFGATSIGQGRIYWFGAVADRHGVQGRTAKKDVLDTFKGWTEPVEALIASTPDVGILSHDLYDRKPSRVWGRGPVTLLGDAAHPMTPFMGQGGCQALEDSFALAAAVKAKSDLPSALRCYESFRIKRASRYVRRSRKSQRVTMTQSAILCWVRDWMLQCLPKPLLVHELHTLSKVRLSHVDD